MNKKYPITTEKHYPNGTGHFSPCAFCGGEFEKNEGLTIIETRWSYMRGDDDVDRYHVKCLRKQKKGYKADEYI